MPTRVNCAGMLGVALTLGMAAAFGADPVPKELTWEDLMPPASVQPAPALPGAGIPGKNAPPYNTTPKFVQRYTPNPVRSLDGKFVKLPGYIVPLESDAGGLLNEFLLVPYFGACIHVPPPPPNQIVYVKLTKPFNLRSMADPYWITGTITTKVWSSDVADTDYVMTAIQVEALN